MVSNEIFVYMMSATISSSILLKCITALFLALNIKASGELNFEIISFVTDRISFPTRQSDYRFQINFIEPGTPTSTTTTFSREYPGIEKNISFNQISKNEKEDEIILQFETLPSVLNISIAVSMIDLENQSHWTITFETYSQGIEIYGMKRMSVDDGRTELTYRVTMSCDLSFYGTRCDRFCNNSEKYTCTTTGEKVCKPGWTNSSSNCEEDKNECLTFSKPCTDGWKCENTLGSYTCKCPRGFVGMNCEVAVKPCDSSPCENNGNCTNNLYDYHCNCENGYSGRHCELDHNKCRWMPCGVGNNCTNIGTDYVCDCIKGYTGKNCEEDVNECLTTLTHQKSLCQNNGTCINTNGGYYCECKIPFKGKTCLLYDNDYEIYDGRFFSRNFLSAFPLLAFVGVIIMICVVYCMKNLFNCRRSKEEADENTDYRKHYTHVHRIFTKSRTETYDGANNSTNSNGKLHYVTVS